MGHHHTFQLQLSDCLVLRIMFCSCGNNPVEEISPLRQSSMPLCLESGALYPLSWLRFCHSNLHTYFHLERPSSSQTAFPHCHGLLETPSTDLKCGFYSAIARIRTQLDDIPTRTVPEFDAIFVFLDQENDLGHANTNNFHVDQLAAVLGHGGAQHGRHLQFNPKLDITD